MFPQERSVKVSRLLVLMAAALFIAFFCGFAAFPAFLREKSAVWISLCVEDLLREGTAASRSRCVKEPLRQGAAASTSRCVKEPLCENAALHL